MSFLSALESVAREAHVFPFREPQVRAFQAMERGSDLLLVWPTGSGKSLCYQLPALVRPGLAVVVSPLIALMEDQTVKGQALSWPVTCIHSALSREEKHRRLQLVREGQVKLLYVTPERFRQPAFCAVLRNLKISLLAVDEAHCISQWGHDFRPDYARVGEIRKELGAPQTVALTATATVDVQKDILLQLGIPNAEMLWEGVARPNLFLGADEFDHPDDKLEPLVDWLKTVQGPKIVYFTLISSLEKVAENLRNKMSPFVIYHGDLADRERARAQNEFLAGQTDTIFATPAFGLGVDKANVRGVLHYELPGSLEAYYQEVGRAGRDGLKSECRLFYTQQDLDVQMRFIDSLTPDPDYVRATYDLLNKWQDRLVGLNLDDLREQLSFKNKRDFRLETALNFLDRLGVINWSARRLDRLTFERPWEAGDFTPELWAARRQQLQLKLLNLVQWFRSEDCRKVGIYKYFGWNQGLEPCGFCDRCRELER